MRDQGRATGRNHESIVERLFSHSIKVKEIKMKKVIWSVVLALILLISVTFAASAQANRTYLKAVEYDCFVGMGTEPWMEGNVMHLRDVLHVNVDVSDTPEFNGINTTLADAEVNTNTGGMVIRGTLSFQPEGIDGTWEGSWVFIGTKGRGFAQSVAHGTGALAGMTLFLKVYDVAPDDPLYENLPAMCAGIGEPEGIVIAEGYILEP
jgi:hypothetical protein